MASPVLERHLADLRARVKAKVKRDCEDDLYEFVRVFWHVVEPANPLIEGWVMEAICLHLQAISNNEIQRALINVPPGCSKSLLSCVFFPAWEWGPRNMPSLRYAAFSYTSTLTERDNGRLLQLINSPLYREYWGDRFSVYGGEVKVKNSHTGWKLATSIAGVGTGERADRLLLDDLNNVKESESKAILENTNKWIREVMPTRLNHLGKSAIVNIQQRTAEDDATGTLIAARDDWTWLMIPMRYDPMRHCTTAIGWEDPRTYENELCWEDRFPTVEVAALEREMGPYAWAGQMQQSPSPRGGGIIKTEWWQNWEGKQSPPMDYVIASLDTAMTEREDSDYSALTVWGSFQSPGAILIGEDGSYDFSGTTTYERETGDNWSSIPSTTPKLFMAAAWRERLNLPALVEKVIATCLKWRVQVLVIENKAHGHAVLQTIREMTANLPFGITMFDPRQYGDKSARLYAVQHLFSEGLVYTAVEKSWADMVIQEVGAFPRGANDDLVDSCSMGLQHMRQRSFVSRPIDTATDTLRGLMGKKGAPRALYEA